MNDTYVSEVMEASQKGKDIQVRKHGGFWEDTDTGGHYEWDWVDNSYRVKPKISYGITLCDSLSIKENSDNSGIFDLIQESMSGKITTTYLTASIIKRIYDETR